MLEPMYYYKFRWILNTNIEVSDVIVDKVSDVSIEKVSNVIVEKEG